MDAACRIHYTHSLMLMILCRIKNISIYREKICVNLREILLVALHKVGDLQLPGRGQRGSRALGDGGVL